MVKSPEEGPDLIAEERWGCLPMIGAALLLWALAIAAYYWLCGDTPL